jgi:ParB/RepB/Spo0J family partition protein
MTAQIRVDAIEAGPNDRNVFDAVELQGLAASMAKVGLLEAIVVRRKGRSGSYEIVAGERRWRAARLLGWDTIDANVRKLDDDVAAEAMSAENLARRDLNPMEEAGAYRKLAELGHDVDAIATICGKTPDRVRTRLGLLDLLPEVQKLVADGQLKVDFGRMMAGLDTNRQRIALRTLNTLKLDWHGFREVCDRLRMEQGQGEMFGDLELVAEEFATTVRRPRRPSRNDLVALVADLHHVLLDALDGALTGDELAVVARATAALEAEGLPTTTTKEEAA